MQRKIIPFPAPGTPRRSPRGPSLPPAPELELTMTIPKAQPGTSTDRY